MSARRLCLAWAVAMTIVLAPMTSAMPPRDPRVDPTRVAAFPVEELPRVGELLIFPEANVDGTVVMAGTEITLASDVFFDYNDFALTSRASSELIAVADRLGEASTTLLVVGHTDSRGIDADNLVLSRHRAEAVRDFLASLIPGRTIEAVGRGEAEPVASNNTDAGRALNRRVTITVGE